MEETYSHTITAKSTLFTHEESCQLYSYRSPRLHALGLIPGSLLILNALARSGAIPERSSILEQIRDEIVYW